MLSKPLGLNKWLRLCPASPQTQSLCSLTPPGCTCLESARLLCPPHTYILSVTMADANLETFSESVLCSPPQQSPLGLGGL